MIDGLRSDHRSGQRSSLSRLRRRGRDGYSVDALVAVDEVTTVPFLI